MKRILVLLVLFLGISLAAASASADTGKRPFEVLSYPDVQSLVAASKGKVVMINFFATWCPPCREEIPGLMRIRASYGEDKLVLIGASLDEDEDALRQYLTEMKLNYPVKKSGMDLAGAAGVSGIPHLLIFDGEGEVAANQPGYVPESDLRAFLQKIMEAK